MPQNNTIEAIKAIGALLSPFAMIAVAIFQYQMNKRQKIIHGQINGMQEKLVTAEKGISKAEGKEEQRQQSKEESKPVVNVNIVDQDKPVKVVTENPKNKI